MYTITIKNYYVNGILNKNETVLYTIPIQENQIENILTDPSVSCELGKTGTFEFTIYPNHPYYHALAQMRTIMRVEYDGDTIFRGRVLTIDNTMKGAKKVHCEGDMAFLLDSFQMGSKKETRDEITLNAYINKILNEHNQQMMEEEASYSDGTAISGTRISGKEIYPGYIPGAYPDSVTSAQQIANKKDKFGSDSAEQTMNALEALTKEFGGFFRTRYSARDNKTYLDWCKLWFREDTANSQPIAIAQNIIDANSNSEVDNIFTAVIPIGSNKGEDVFITGYRTDIHGNNNHILVPQITKVYTESQLNNGYVNKSIYERAVKQYGIIYKVQKFSNADTQEKLWNYACDWIKNNYVGGITSYDLSAVDMHHVDDTIVKYLAGDRVNLTIHSDMTELDEYNPDKQSNTIRRTLLGVKYDLHHPEKNKYTAGIPSDILNLEYGTASTSKGGGGGAGAKAGGNKNTGDNEKRDQEARQEAMDSLAWDLLWDEIYYNSEEYKALQEKYNWKMSRPVLNTSQLMIYRAMNDPQVKTKQDVASIVMEGEKVRLSLMDPGNNGYERLKNSPAFSKYPQLANMIDKARDVMTKVTLDASMKAFSLRGKNTEQLNDMVGKVNAVQLPEDATAEDYRKAIENNIAGIDLPKDVVKLTTNKDGSGNESGFLQMAKEAVSNIQLDSGGSSGEGTADIGKTTSSGSFKVNLNRAVTYKDKEGNTVTKTGFVSADDFRIKDSYDSLKVRLLVVNELIADKATIGDLNAVKGRINTIESDYITTSELSARVLSVVSGNTLDLTCSRLNDHALRWQRFTLMTGDGTTTTATFLIAGQSGQ